MKAKAAAVASEIATENASASRNARALNTSLIRIQLEADGPDIDDEAPDAGGVEFAAQVVDLDVDDIGLRQEFEVPHVLEQHCAGHYLTGAAHEIFQELEFPRKQVNELAVAPDRPLNKIHFQRADLQPSDPRVAAPAQERAVGDQLPSAQSTAEAAEFECRVGFCRARPVTSVPQPVFAIEGGFGVGILRHRGPSLDLSLVIWRGLARWPR